MILLSSAVPFLLLLYGSRPSNREQFIVYHLFGGLFFSNQICRRELAFFPSLQINDVSQSRELEDKEGYQDVERHGIGGGNSLLVPFGIEFSLAYTILESL
ncbi:hypothetical protein D5086_033187 [Populus alba]|uniref:Uncharacterized protein n=1 Tax=Populus alba TaxID=43335 RepID=A0ACC4AG44_POPAL